MQTAYSPHPSHQSPLPLTDHLLLPQLPSLAMEPLVEKDPGFLYIRKDVQDFPLYSVGGIGESASTIFYIPRGLT